MDYYHLKKASSISLSFKDAPVQYQECENALFRRLPAPGRPGHSCRRQEMAPKWQRFHPTTEMMSF